MRRLVNLVNISELGELGKERTFFIRRGVAPEWVFQRFSCNKNGGSPVSSLNSLKFTKFTCQNPWKGVISMPDFKNWKENAKKGFSSFLHLNPPRKIFRPKKSFGKGLGIGQNTQKGESNGTRSSNNIINDGGDDFVSVNQEREGAPFIMPSTTPSRFVKLLLPSGELTKPPEQKVVADWDIFLRYSPVEPMSPVALRFLWECMEGSQSFESFIARAFSFEPAPAAVYTRELHYLRNEGYISVHHSTRRGGKLYRYYAPTRKGREYIRRATDFRAVGGREAREIARAVFDEMVWTGWFISVARKQVGIQVPDLVAHNAEPFLPYWYLMSFDTSEKDRDRRAHMLAVEVETSRELRANREQVRRNLSKWKDLGFGGLLVAVKNNRDLEYLASRYLSSVDIDEKIWVFNVESTMFHDLYSIFEEEEDEENLIE